MGDDVDGEVTLENNGDYLSGNYTLSTTGKDNIEIDGTFTKVNLKES